MPDMNSAPQPAASRITVANYAKMGELVKIWVDDKTKRPADMRALQAQMDAHQTGGKVPPELLDRQLVVVQSDATTYYLRVPAKDLMDRSVNELGRNPTEYGVPDYYKDLAFHVDPSIAPEDMMKFHNSRIGDYTISNCK